MQQGLGRLIRHRQDRGVLAVPRSAAPDDGLWAAILESLPPAPVTHDLEAVARFFV
jgi:Rad3-related DNA helicase